MTRLMLFIVSVIKNRVVRVVVICILVLVAGSVSAQPAHFTTIKKNPSTKVKNQSNTGTCWSFSTTSLIESESIQKELGEFDLSEMFIARKVYVDKAKNYILRQGAAQFGPGGLGHDVVNAVDKYGIMPESAYSGLLIGKRNHDHSKLDAELKTYLDSLLKQRPIPATWLQKFESILDEHLGRIPQTFMYNEKTYTPESFAREVVKFNKSDYVLLTSFTHHPFYERFVLEIPDNYANESYYNIPLAELMNVIEQAVMNGHSVMWDADVSNKYFKQKEGLAMVPVEGAKFGDTNAQEIDYSQDKRQQLFEELTTQDDHLMHIVGIEQNAKGKKFFLVKNSWGEVGPYNGYIKVSEPYMAINTITIIVPKAALDTSLKSKLNVN
jgi:bleomycin hydrolase